MPHLIQQPDARTLWVTFEDVLTQADLNAAQTAARDLIAKAGKIRGMIVLQRFRGFAKGVDWGDLAFYASHGDQIERMAIVGDSKWEADVLAMTGKGARVTEIEFFTTDKIAAAHAWLNRP